MDFSKQLYCPSVANINENIFLFIPLVSGSRIPVDTKCPRVLDVGCRFVYVLLLLVGE